MEFVHDAEIGGRQLIEILAGASQLVRNCARQFEIFAIMACDAVDHRIPHPWTR
ncbi:MAG TPA: hypothetical protein PLB34_12130 [Rhodoblastus sp.]|nr:hypothetical protein [Rhodoblastus sp.]